jgi:hypothetical protein
MSKQCITHHICDCLKRRLETAEKVCELAEKELGNIRKSFNDDECEADALVIVVQLKEALDAWKETHQDGC